MIDINTLKAGMKVYLMSLTHTDPEFGINGQMKEMIGKWWPISTVRNSRKGVKMIHPCGREYIFSIKDIMIKLDPNEKPKIIHYKNGNDILFNESNLLV